MSLRRVYETTVIINAALEDADIDAVISKITNYIESHGGEISQINKWGRRRLAYPINKKYNGYYVHLVFNSVPSVLPVLERFLVLEDTVLRHLTLVLPERLRKLRLEKALAEGKSGENTTLSFDEPEKKEAKNEKATPTEEKNEPVTTEEQPVEN
jgi:small subunit ribosomal protein S6